MIYNYTAYLTVIISSVGAGIVTLLAHRFSKRREAAARLATAAAKFRATVESLVVQIPPASMYWGKELLPVFQSTVSDIGVAVAEFNPFLLSGKRARFQAEWQSFKSHCEEAIPQSLSAQEVLYGGGPEALRAAKEQFHIRVQALLSYAQQV